MSSWAERPPSIKKDLAQSTIGNYLSLVSSHLNHPFAAYSGTQPYIFVSYAHKDSALVFPELLRLNAMGLNVWYDEGVIPGHEWPKEIASALVGSSLFLLFVTPHSIQSPNCRNEVYLAAQVRKPFLIVYLEDTDVVALDVGLALMIGSIQGIMKHQLLEDHYEKKLKASLQSLREMKATLSEVISAIDKTEATLESASNAQNNRGLTIPQRLLGLGQKGTVLKLTPIAPPSSQFIPIHLSSGKSFKIGRKPESVDLAAWFLPRSRENDERTLRITSVHCSLEWRESGIWMQDHQATNLTYLNRRQVIGEIPFPLSTPAEIGLAGSFMILATAFPTTVPEGLEIANISTSIGAPTETPQSAPFGSLQLVARDRPAVLHHAVWLLTDGTLGTSPSNPIPIDSPGLAETQARIYYSRGIHWLENLVDNGAVSVDSIEIKTQEIIPLVSGQVLQLGGVQYRVDVSDHS